MIKQVVCVKWGTKYDATYVNRLYAMVERNLTPPFRFVCLTDSRADIRPEVECFDLPELGCPHPDRTFGKWKKVVLWGREVPGLTGVALYIDLDSVVVSSLDDYFTFGDPSDVILARNWAYPLRRLGQTSVFRYPVGANAHILEDFRADPQGIADRFHYEQHYMTHAVKGGIKFWPGAWTRHFRQHCLPTFPLRLFVPARLPKTARIVTFAGGPNLHDVLLARWNTHSRPGRLRHLPSHLRSQPRQRSPMAPRQKFPVASSLGHRTLVRVKELVPTLRVGTQYSRRSAAFPRQLAARAHRCRPRSIDLKWADAPFETATHRFHRRGPRFRDHRPL